MTSQFVPTLTNMVAIVRNIIDGYGMGAIRALAQEPVQNSKDAAPRGRAHVEYRLHKRRSGDGQEIFLLTVTDSNTTGLRGPIRSLADISQGGALSEGENWAAFEGMGYTKKSSEDALGSRGQGKAAYLYHSNLPPVAALDQARMMMLYDTLLGNGEYRLGVRYANPSDSVRQPPFQGDEARRVVSTHYTSDSIEVSLGLEPLTQVGTRIIMPYLSAEAVAAFQSGELYQWLQRCWWRAVQTGLTITLVDEHGARQEVGIPPWWEGEPWKRRTDGLRLYQNIDVGSGLKIKRIVLRYDESWDGDDSEFWGVQLLRGQQWIETLGRETLADYIPPIRRPGFRGFVEFERDAERELRRAENSQHERFDRRVSGVKNLIDAVERRVAEFAEEQGWSPSASTRPAPGAEQAIALDFLRFLAPNARRRANRGASGAAQPELLPQADRWECDLLFNLPNPETARVDWGQYIRQVAVDVRLEPQRASEYAIVALELVHANDRTLGVPLGSREVAVRHGAGMANFGDFRIVRGIPSPGDLQCAQQGPWRLKAQVASGGNRVARASRRFYVNEDPPGRSRKPYALSISAENHTTPGQRRIDKGDSVGIQINVTNRSTERQVFTLIASLGDLLLADGVPVTVPGTPAGAEARRHPGVQTQIVVNPPTGNPETSVNLSPGRHALNADLHVGDEIVAHASRILDIEVDPAQPEGWPPFKVQQVSDERPRPRWRLRKEEDGQDDWVLEYPAADLLYRALEVSGSNDRARLSGVNAFVVEVCAEGVVEWAVEPVASGDESHLSLLLDGLPEGADESLWEDYREKMEQLAALRGDDAAQPSKYGELLRECAALSLSMFEQREAR